MKKLIIGIVSSFVVIISLTSFSPNGNLAHTSTYAIKKKVLPKWYVSCNYTSPAAAQGAAVGMAAFLNGLGLTIVSVNFTEVSPNHYCYGIGYMLPIVD